MVADPEIGLINLKTKEILHEFHICAKKATEMLKFDISWGTKLVTTSEVQYLSMADCLVMPYSLLSIV